MSKDEVFKEIKKPSDFKFNRTVVNVFDDMVNRSVPFYEEIQRMIAEQSASHAREGTAIYDLGCSTGTTFLSINPFVPPTVKFIGVDDSQEMLAKCDAKFKAACIERPYELVQADIAQPLQIEAASVVVMCLTLQFVRPLYRERLLKSVYEGLEPGGVVILVEKILAEESSFNRHFIDYYYEMKRRHHYTENEIAQKREALENVLIPYKLSENILLLKETGFSHHEIFFKWYNFAGIIAKK
ncbi:MAG: carboxy-S-adenosyl-L-methionine synthase CmoA [Williamsia sp.]|nr:carboxy-S-adenosyl-L-methionine synthase CmoA [Williamsia sp.]